MISTSVSFTFVRWVHLFMTKHHQWHNWRVVQTSWGVYLCQRTIFWTFDAKVCFCDQKKNPVISAKRLVWSSAISSKGLYFYILQLLIRPNSGRILKIRPNACRHLKSLCKLGLRPKFILRTKSDLFIKSPTVSFFVSVVLSVLIKNSLQSSVEYLKRNEIRKSVSNIEMWVKHREMLVVLSRQRWGDVRDGRASSAYAAPRRWHPT